MEKTIEIENFVLEHLRPPRSCLQNKFEDEYIVTKNKKLLESSRKIYYYVEYQTEEIQRLENFAYHMKSENVEVPLWWRHADSLRMLRSCHFKEKVAIEHIQEHVATLNKLMKGLSPLALEVIKSGFFYILGRDKHYRPIIVGDMNRAGNLSKERMHAVVEAFTFVSFIVRFSMHVPGKVENTLFFFNLRHQNKPELQKLILDQAKIINKNCPGTLEKLFLFETPAFVRLLLFLAKPFFSKETLDKIIVVDNKSLNKIEEFVCLDQLETSFGGKRDSLTKFYPFEVPAEDQLTKEDLLNSGIIPFTSSEDEFVHLPIELIKSQLDTFHHQEKILSVIEEYKQSKKEKYMNEAISKQSYQPKKKKKEKSSDTISNSLLMDFCCAKKKTHKKYVGNGSSGSEKDSKNSKKYTINEEEEESDEEDFCNIFQFYQLTKFFGLCLFNSLKTPFKFFLCLRRQKKNLVQ